MFSQCRKGHAIPTNKTLEKMIEMSSLAPYHQVYLAAYAQKIENTKVAEAFIRLAA
jgi:hypothetical protein